MPLMMNSQKMTMIMTKYQVLKINPQQRVINIKMILLLSKNYNQQFKKRINWLDYKTKLKFGRHIDISPNKYSYLITRLLLKIQLTLVNQRLNKFRSVQKLRKKNLGHNLKWNPKKRNLRIVLIFAVVVLERTTIMYLIHLSLGKKLLVLNKTYNHRPK